MTQTTLTPKQQAFVNEYLIDLNATQAALRAGYSEKTAGKIGGENLQKPEIQQAIQASMEARGKRLEITAERVILELARIAFADTRKLYDADGNLKPIHELDDDTAACIGGVKVKVVDGETTTTDVKIWPKDKALDLLAKHFALFTDRLELAVSQKTVASMSDAELEALAAGDT